MKKWSRWIWVCLLVFATGIPVKAASAEEKKTEVVFLIDASSSMQDNDPDRLAVEAVKIFVELGNLNWQEMQGGIISFSSQINSQSEMKSMEDDQDREILWQEAENIKYDGYTDIGAAMQAGVGLFSQDEKNDKMIVLLTDGKIDLEEGQGRTEEKSYEDVKAACEKAEEDNIEIYSIGLNNGGEVDEALLKEISEENYYEAKSDEDLKDIFISIFAELAEGDKKESSEETIPEGHDHIDKTIQIINKSVMKADLVLSSTGGIDRLELFDPKGEEVLSNTDQVIRTDSRSFTMLKMLYPEKGDWTLRVYGKGGDVVSAAMLFTYDLELYQENKLRKEYEQEEPFEMEAVLKKGEEVIEDETLLADFTGSVVLKNSEGEEKRIPLKREGRRFFGSVAPEEAGDYKIYLSVTSEREGGEELEYTTEPIEIKIVKKQMSKTLLAGGILGGVLLLAAVLIITIKKPWRPKRIFSGELTYQIIEKEGGEVGKREICFLLGKKGRYSLDKLLEGEERLKKRLKLAKVEIEAMKEVEEATGVEIRIKTSELQNEQFEGKGKIVLMNRDSCVLKTKDETVELYLKYEE